MKLKSLQCGNVVTSEISYGFTSFHIFIAYLVILYILSEMGKSKGYYFFGKICGLQRNLKKQI